jgi:hypothetical protein
MRLAHAALDPQLAANMAREAITTTGVVDPRAPAPSVAPSDFPYFWWAVRPLLNNVTFPDLTEEPPKPESLTVGQHILRITRILYGAPGAAIWVNGVRVVISPGWTNLLTISVAEALLFSTRHLFIHWRALDSVPGPFLLQGMLAKIRALEPPTAERISSHAHPAEAPHAHPFATDWDALYHSLAILSPATALIVVDASHWEVRGGVITDDESIKLSWLSLKVAQRLANWLGAGGGVGGVSVLSTNLNAAARRLPPTSVAALEETAFFTRSVA